MEFSSLGAAVKDVSKEAVAKAVKKDTKPSRPSGSDISPQKVENDDATQNAEDLENEEPESKLLNIYINVPVLLCLFYWWLEADVVFRCSSFVLLRRKDHYGGAKSKIASAER